MTSTVMEQEVEAPIQPPVREIEEPPFGAVRVPLQLFSAITGSASITSAGKVSVNARSVTVEASPLVIVKTSDVVLPGPMVEERKALLNSGG